MARKKKAMTIIDLKAWVNEASEELTKSRINNIYHVQNYWLLKISTHTGKKYLKIEPGIRIHTSVFEPPQKGIDKFTAFLRKHVRRGVIEDIKVLDFERIVVFGIRSHGYTYNLVAEIIPRGVLALLKEGIILYASKFLEMRDRAIKPRYKYIPPPRGINPFEASIEELVDRLKKGKDLVRGIIYGWNLPGEIAEEILYRAGLYDVKTAKPTTIAVEDVDKLVEELKSLYRESLSGKGYLVEAGSSFLSYAPYYPRLLGELHGFNVITVERFSEAVDRYYMELEKELVAKTSREALEKEISKIKKSIEGQRRIIDKYRDLSKLMEKYTKLLGLHYNEVADIIRCIKEHWGSNVKDVCRNVVEIERDKGIVKIAIEGEPVSVDLKQSLDHSIKKYYRLAGEYRGKAERASRSLEELERKLKELEHTIGTLVEKAVHGIKPKLWYERFHWLITSEGYLVIAGKNADQNEAIVRKYLEPSDVFLHADIHGAPATVIKTRGKLPGEKSIREAAVIAACYSKAWKAGFGEVDVYWVRGEQVSKKAPSGEYLSKGSFMIYGKKNYIRHIRLELAIGVEEVHDEIYGVYQRVIVGPQDLVKDKAIVYTVIVPGEYSVGEIAKRIYNSWRRILEGKIFIKLEEVMERIPGPSKISNV